MLCCFIYTRLNDFLHYSMNAWGELLNCMFVSITAYACVTINIGNWKSELIHKTML